MNNFIGAPSVPNNSGAASPFPTYTKMTAIPCPSLCFVTLDEREDSINDGTFFVNVANFNSIIDIPASYHNGAAGFSFADGHSEIHRWLSGALKVPIQTTPINNMAVTSTAGNQPDAFWLYQHALGHNSFP
jgi:prepilin-type processing-associated H-X9-DG protein